MKQEFLNHPVQNYDTLSGLSLQYRVSIFHIKKLNKLSSDSILHLKTIKIPITKHNKNIKIQQDSEREKKEDKILSLDALELKYGEVGRRKIEGLLQKNKFDYEKTEKQLKLYLERTRKIQSLRTRFKISEERAIEILTENNWNLESVKKSEKYGDTFVEMKTNYKGKIKID